MYHGEEAQEDFSCSSGEAPPHRRGRGAAPAARGISSHCPARTEHDLRGRRTTGPCLVVAVGARRKGRGLRYPVNEIGSARRRSVERRRRPTRVSPTRGSAETAPIACPEGVPPPDSRSAPIMSVAGRSRSVQRPCGTLRPSNLLALVQRDGLASNRRGSFAWSQMPHRVAHRVRQLIAACSERRSWATKKNRPRERELRPTMPTLLGGGSQPSRGARADVDGHRAASEAWIGWRQSPAPSLVPAAPELESRRHRRSPRSPPAARRSTVTGRSSSRAIVVNARVLEAAGRDPLGERRRVEVDVERVAVRRHPAA